MNYQVSIVVIDEKQGFNFLNASLEDRPICYFVSDAKISERHLLLESTIDTLDMENEAYSLAYYMSWIFYPIFIVVGFGQILLICLYVEKCHPFSEILKGAEKPGK